MFNKNRGFRSGNRSRSRFSRGPRRFGGHSRGTGPGLNPALLVRKAQEQVLEAEYQVKNSFNDFALNLKLSQNIISHGFTTPTPIQDQAIPHLLENRDLVGIANTGTGKTAAFLIPLINKLYLQRGKKALIIAPTRELAVQIQDECRLFAQGLNIYSLLCIGGASLYQQKGGLRQNPQIIVGTPGRLKDLHNQRALNFIEYDTIILDEVDRMLDMGFIQDIKYIISYLPKVRQSLFFSATLSPNIHSLITTFSYNPVFLSVKSQETPNNVDQDIIRVNGRQKVDILNDLLRQEGFNKILIFGRTKFGVERLSRTLAEKGHRVAAIHGNKNQNQRQRALDEFKCDKVNVLLATDIASRGLDIPNISHVINFDLPKTYEDYVHRIGRTGRINKKGIALSFVD